MVRKTRKKPPWGNLFDGWPIEILDPQNDDEKKLALERQLRRMCRLRAHYGIKDDDKTGWYKLALALASKLDDALTIVESPPPPSSRGRTAPKWRGLDGLHLVIEFNKMRERYRAAGRDVTDLALLREFQEKFPSYMGIRLETLERGYYAAMKHWRPHLPGSKRAS